MPLPSEIEQQHIEPTVDFARRKRERDKAASAAHGDRERLSRDGEIDYGSHERWAEFLAGERDRP